MHMLFVALWTLVNDVGQWAAIAILTAVVIRQGRRIATLDGRLRPVRRVRQSHPSGFDESDRAAAMIMLVLMPSLILTWARFGFDASVALQIFFVIIFGGVLAARVRYNRRRMTEGE